MSVTIVRDVPVAAIRESKWNPRSRYDEAALADLARSVKTKGLLQPVLLRPAGVGYEIAVGHRRVRAARLAGLASVPATIRSLSDEELLEILVEENDQREDVHPLDQAEGYRRLLEIGRDVAEIASRVGRDTSYVYDRLRLLSLIPEVREAFLRDDIVLAHAKIFARHSAKDQARGFEVLYRPDLLASRVAISARELDAWFDRNVRIDPAAEDFPDLFPEAFDAIAAAEETGTRIVEITFEEKVPDQARGEKAPLAPSRWRMADPAAGAKRCDRSVVGVVAVGVHRGKSFEVCLARKDCRVHWKEEIEDRERVEKAAAKTGGKEAAKKARDEFEERQREEQQRLHAEAADWRAAFPRIEAAIEKAALAGSVEPGSYLRRILWERLCRGQEPRKDAMPLDELVRTFAAAVLVEEARFSNRTRFAKAAKELRIDLDALIAGGKTKEVRS